MKSRELGVVLRSVTLPLFGVNVVFTDISEPTIRVNRPKPHFQAIGVRFIGKY